MKISKEEMARISGMQYALKVAKRDGIDGLEKEIKYRCTTKIPLAISRETVEQANANMRRQTVDTVCIVSTLVLRDTFNFGKERLNRFIDAFSLQSECLTDERVTFEDMACALADEVPGVRKLLISYNNNNVKIRRSDS